MLVEPGCPSRSVARREEVLAKSTRSAVAIADRYRWRRDGRQFGRVSLGPERMERCPGLGTRHVSI